MALLRPLLHLPRRQSAGSDLAAIEPVPSAGRPAAPAAASATGGTAATREPDLPNAKTSSALQPRRRSSRPRPGLLPDEPVVPEVEQERPLRLLLVEEVPEVAAHVREMLRSQPSMHLVAVVAEGRRVLDEVQELRPDIVIADPLLGGRPSGLQVIERIRKGVPGLPILALGAASGPDAERVRELADGVVAMPFGTIDLARAIRDAHAGRASRDPAAATRLVAVYAAKGGVGKTTIAFNLAAALASSGTRTALVDGSLQYGDLRRLLRIEPTEPSICDLPTDCVRRSDLAGAMRRGPGGIDVLLAPPRLEMADLVTARDLDKILDLLRRTYQAIVVDTPSALNDTTLTVLDLADVILQVLTPEPAALDSTRAAATAFAAIGYPATKVRTVINRADAQGGLAPDQLRRALGREPDHRISSDWQLVSASNQEGVPFVVARPGAQVSRDLNDLAEAVMSVIGTVPARLPTRIRSRARGGTAASAR